MKLHERMTAILEIRDLRTTPRMVLVCLACHANRDMKAWPSVTTIAKEVGCDEGAVRRALKALNEKGYISGPFSKGRTTHRLTVHLQPLQSARVNDRSTPAKRRGSGAQDDHCKMEGIPSQNAGDTPAKCRGNSSRTVQEQKDPPAAGATGAASGGRRWTEGIATLTAAGTSERSARSLVAMLCKQHGDEAVEGAVGRMVAIDPADPSAWLIAAFGRAKQNDPAARYRAEAEAIERELGIKPEEF